MKAEVELKQIKHKCEKCGNEDDIEVEVHRKSKEKVVVDDNSDIREKLDTLEKLLTPKQAAAEEKPKKEKVIVQSYEPKYHCPDGNCEIGVHKNENYKERPAKKCTTCDQFAPKRAKKCAWCGESDFDELSDDDLDDLKIPKPAHEGHDHE